jgi:hypothetical protein
MSSSTSFCRNISGSAIVPVRPPKLPCSSLRYARRGRAVNTQIQTRHICFNNRRRAATRQGKQTPIIDQRKHAETRKHQPTHTNPKNLTQASEPPTKQWAVWLLSHVVLHLILPQHFGSAIVPVCTPTKRKPNWVVPPNEAMAIQIARSSSPTAPFVLAIRPQGKSRAYANSNPPYLLQQSQTSLHAPKQADPQILTNASTPKLESTNQRTPTQKPDPSLCTAHSSVGGSAFMDMPCSSLFCRNISDLRLDRSARPRADHPRPSTPPKWVRPCLHHNLAAMNISMNRARSSTKTALFVLAIRPQGKSRAYANSNPPYLLQQSQTSLHAPRQADPKY